MTSENPLLGRGDWRCVDGVTRELKVDSVDSDGELGWYVTGLDEGGYRHGAYTSMQPPAAAEAPEKFSPLTAVKFLVAFPTDIAAWVDEQAKKQGVNPSTYLAKLVENDRNW